jgi:adenylate cyclase
MSGHPGPGIEIERKYLLRGLPPRVHRARVVTVHQGWLEAGRRPVRLRRVREGGHEYWTRTVKKGLGLVRSEQEEPLSRRCFRALWPGTQGRRVRKRRYFIPQGDLTWEIDEFLDLPLVLAEVELPTEETEVVPPGWLCPWIVAEVTERPEYTNLQLARHGLPVSPSGGRRGIGVRTGHEGP